MNARNESATFAEHVGAERACGDSRWIPSARAFSNRTLSAARHSCVLLPSRGPACCSAHSSAAIKSCSTNVRPSMRHQCPGAPPRGGMLGHAASKFSVCCGAAPSHDEMPTASGQSRLQMRSWRACNWSGTAGLSSPPARRLASHRLTSQVINLLVNVGIAGPKRP
jgi:hypothetical protein